jgi:hypothetical protein
VNVAFIASDAHARRALRNLSFGPRHGVSGVIRDVISGWAVLGGRLNIRRLVAPVLSVLLLLGVGVGIWQSNARLEKNAGEHAVEVKAATVRGLIGSEKESFFADPRVREALAARGLQVEFSKAGSREIATKYDPTQYDFGFPSGAPSGAKLKQLAHASNVYTPFYTPIVLASFRPIAEILIANDVAKKDGDFYYIVDLPKLMKLIEQGKRWNELRSSEAFQTRKSVLISSTDVRSSNSAAMYLSLASYLANEQQVVQSQADVDKVLPAVSPLFLRQGFQESSSAGPFEDYQALGMGKTPLLLAYESQLIETWLQHPDQRKGDMVLLYPKPTVFSKHVFVPYTPAGDRLGQALEQDETLRKLAHEHGFRTGGDERGPSAWAQHGITVPDALDDVIDPPSYEWLERMIVTIEGLYQ